MSDSTHSDKTLDQLRLEILQCRQERQDAIRALKELQRELADQQAISRIGTWSRDADSDIPVWSDQAYVIHGVPIGMPLNRDSISKLIVEEDRVRIRKTYDEAMENRRAFRIVYRIRRPDGQIRVLHSDNLVSENPETGKVTLHGAVQDITHPTDETEEIADPNDVFPQDSIVVDLDGIIVRSSGTMRSMLSRLEPGGSVFQLLAAGDSHEDLEAALDEIEQGAENKVVQLLIDSLDQPAKVGFCLAPWMDHNQLRGFILSPEHAENTNTGQEEVDLPIPISGAWEFERETNRSLWSEGMFDILGLDRSSDPLTIQEFRSMVHPEDQPMYMQDVGNFYETLEPLSFRFRIISQTGDTKWVMGHMEAVSRTGPNSHFFGTLTDLSDRETLQRTARQQRLRVKSLEDSLEHMNLRLLEASMRLSKAQEEERTKIAVNLHDNAGGLITSLNLKLNLMEQDGAEEHITTFRSLLDQLGDQIRQTTRQLRPNALSRFGIEAALRELATDFAELRGLSLTDNIEALPVRLSSRTATILFRIAREAILNVVRHADASSLTVELGPHPEGVRLAITDDGIGFDPDLAVASDSMGLESMFDRADSLGGVVSITSQNNTGTTVEVLIPISKLES